jgi:hypothetical protein
LPLSHGNRTRKSSTYPKMAERLSSAAATELDGMRVGSNYDAESRSLRFSFVVAEMNVTAIFGQLREQPSKCETGARVYFEDNAVAFVGVVRKEFEAITRIRRVLEVNDERVLGARFVFESSFHAT